MEPMNKFLTSAAPEFKTFIDKICDVNSSQATLPMEPQYATPTQIKNRLPPASREGLPSLPFLLDSTKLLSELTELWTKYAPANLAEEKEIDDTVKQFHLMCTALQARAKECFSTAEQAERPEEKLEPRWQQALKEQQRRLKTIQDERHTTSPHNDPDLTALPQPEEDYTESTAATDHVHTPVAAPPRDRRLPFHNNARAMTDSTNSSTASFDHVDEGKARATSSRDGSTKSRFLDMMSSGGRRNKTRALDRSYSYDDGHER